MTTEKRGSVVILCAGGPASGINCVISSVSKVFLAKGYRVIGLNEGYKSLVSENPKFVDIDFAIADKIFNKGGSTLVMSRYKPKDEEFSTDFFIKNDVKLLVTIGGDDTASTANRLSKYLRSQNLDVANIHVPKTIDNDLPLPFAKPTFGYSTAVEEGVRIGSTLYEDARTCGNWFVVCAMGREAGHLAYQVGAACHYPMIIVPEMFNKTKITVNKIVRMGVSAMLKRKLLGIDYGVIIISEGVFHFIDEKEFEELNISFPRDAHGHIELYAISKSHLFSQLIMEEMKSVGLSNRCRPLELGYELRCCAPSAADLFYTTKLGIGVWELFKSGATGCVVTLDDKEEVKPLYLKDVEGPDGKITPRLLDFEQSDIDMIYRNNLHYISEEDYSAIAGEVANPEKYDFYKILAE